MVIKPSEKSTNSVQREAAIKAAKEYLNKCFADNYPEVVLGSGELVVLGGMRQSRLYYVPRPLAEIINSAKSKLSIMHAGLFVGFYRRGLFIPSTELFNAARMKGLKFGCAVAAKQQGVKAFLYGNDLLVASVERFLEPVEKGMVVAVSDSEDLFVVGVGILVLGIDEFLKAVRQGRMLEVAVKNIKDLGLLLRSEESYWEL